ncbi:uncharacterized protein RCC_11200 [Ramularia collo-cygni]|uniref:Uncharacterized protein n=1 Tax=Ramularia collo-cygni TaxID=112498 RepID=A0A2D3VSC8_9PEZI|nr:uncharacterized protein RCC_11200 [Ramularia collo-cygni]CZT25468.1 uncharacterized protein RCC_11200 [Ramularia collo-cygni]
MSTSTPMQCSSPAELLQQLHAQSQILVCLQWLCDFQVLACIPLKQMLAFHDVADLVNVPEDHLTRVVRMVATVPFLSEPIPGFVAHNQLSADFVARLSSSDALSFICDVSLPSALHMSRATRFYGASEQPLESSFSLQSGSTKTILSACEQDSKFRRQLSALDETLAASSAGQFKELLLGLDWASMKGNNLVVLIGARSTELLDVANTLTERFSSLSTVIQSWEHIPHGEILELKTSLSSVLGGTPTTPGMAGDRLRVQTRYLGSQQNIYNAAVYILKVPVPSVFVQHKVVLSQVVAELRAHRSILKANPAATLILVAWMVPTVVGVLDPKTEAALRCRDLVLHQLANQRNLEFQDLAAAISGIEDGVGRLVFQTKSTNQSNSMIALEIKYQKD